MSPVKLYCTESFFVMSLVVSFALPRFAVKLPSGDWMKYARSRVWSNQRRPAVSVQLSLGE